VLLGPGRRLVVCRVYGRRSRHTLAWAAATQRAQQTHARVPVAAPAAAAGKRALRGVCWWPLARPVPPLASRSAGAGGTHSNRAKLPCFRECRAIRQGLNRVASYMYAAPTLHITCLSSTVGAAKPR
jgi:hypothetical protein